MSTRIAVFNHSPDILARFRAFLEARGYEVATFLQERDSLAQMLPFNADLVILGYVRGYPANYREFILELRLSPITRALPIIVCTTGEVVALSEEPEDKIEYVSIGRDALNLEFVLVAIRAALDLDDGADD